MNKRLKFNCWNCSKTYTLFQEITNEQTLLVACPFCSSEAVADLKPFRKPKVSVFRGTEPAKQNTDIELQLPETLPTQRPDEDTPREW